LTKLINKVATVAVEFTDDVTATADQFIVTFSWNAVKGPSTKVAGKIIQIAPGTFIAMATISLKARTNSSNTPGLP